MFCLNEKSAASDPIRFVFSRAEDTPPLLHPNVITGIKLNSGNFWQHETFFKCFFFVLCIIFSLFNPNL